MQPSMKTLAAAAFALATIGQAAPYIPSSSKTGFSIGAGLSIGADLVDGPKASLWRINNPVAGLFPSGDEKPKSEMNKRRINNPAAGLFPSSEDQPTGIMARADGAGSLSDTRTQMTKRRLARPSKPAPGSIPSDEDKEKLLAAWADGSGTVPEAKRQTSPRRINNPAAGLFPSNGEIEETDS